VIGGALLLLIAAIGFSYAGLVIRAAPGRRDNLLFGALAATDAAMIAWRGFNVLSGEPLVGDEVLVPCGFGTVAMVVISIEFLAGFPRRCPMRAITRAVVIAWAIGALGLLAFVDRGHDWSESLTEKLFFFPSTLIILGLCAKAWRSTRERAARVVIGMLAFRWAFGFAAYFAAPALGIFEQALWAETTFATLVSFVIIGTAVMRTDLFSIRSSAAEAFVVATIAFGALAGGGGAVRVVLATTAAESGAQAALLVGATLVPLALAGIGWLMWPRLEQRVLAPLDTRRARRLDVEHEREPLPPTTREAIAEATRRITEFSDGAQVTWQLAAALPPALVAKMIDGIVLRSDEVPELAGVPVCLVVPAFGAGRTGATRDVVGAFMLRSTPDATLDRDTYLVARDLAARVALAVEREQAVTELEDARRLAELGQFAAAIAHDIRTPLTSISLNIQILQRKLDLGDDDKEHLDIALEELHRLDRSVAEILDFAKPVKLVTESVDVGDLVEDAARNLSPVMSGKGVALRCERATGAALPAVRGDAQRLRQVLVNLLDNAADASTPGAEVTLRTARADDSHVAIEVEDRGKGIRADDLARIFEPFFTTRPDGTGLGLAICHKVVTAHGGELRVKSSVGVGTTFTVVLPAA
jgi:signal transduction histidine kinase